MLLSLGEWSQEKDATRMHSTRMHTACLPTVGVSVATTGFQYWLEGGLKVNKFEQVFSDDHQMSVPGSRSK